MDQDTNRLQSIYHGSSKWVRAPTCSSGKQIKNILSVLQTRSSSMLETFTSFLLKHEFGSSELSKGAWRGRTGNVVRVEEWRQINFEEDRFYVAIVVFGDNEVDKGRPEGTTRQYFEGTVAQTHGPFDRTRAFGIPTIYNLGSLPDMYKFNKLLEKEFADLREFLSLGLDIIIIKPSQSDLETNRDIYFEEDEQVVFHTIGTEKGRSLPQEYLKLIERKIRKLEAEVDQIKFQPFGSIKPLKFKLNPGGTFPKEFHEELWEHLKNESQRSKITERFPNPAFGGTPNQSRKIGNLKSEPPPGNVQSSPTVGVRKGLSTAGDTGITREYSKVEKAQMERDWRARTCVEAYEEAGIMLSESQAKDMAKHFEHIPKDHLKQHVTSLLQQGKDPLKDLAGASKELGNFLDNITIPDTAANGPLEWMLPTRRERAFMGLPSKKHIQEFNYSRFQPLEAVRFTSDSGELRESTKANSYAKNGIVAIEAEWVETKEGTYAPVRLTVVTTRMKIIKRQKIKPEGSVRDYRVEVTGLSASALADVTLTRAEMTKTLCSMLTNNTIVASFDPAQDLHLMKIAHDRVIKVSELYKKDLALGLPIDRESLVQRYLPIEYKDVAASCQCMGLLLRWYATHNYCKNSQMDTEEMKKEGALPLFPLLTPPNKEPEATSKQSLIHQVHAKLSYYFRENLIREPNPTVFGPTVIRVHVKKWLQIKGIEKRVVGLSAYLRDKLKNELNLPAGDHELFRLCSLPISMKSKTQAKGFFCYFDFADLRLADEAILYFQRPEIVDNQEVKYKCEKSIPRKSQDSGNKAQNNANTYDIIRTN